MEAKIGHIMFVAKQNETSLPPKKLPRQLLLNSEYGDSSIGKHLDSSQDFSQSFYSDFFCGGANVSSCFFTKFPRLLDNDILSRIHS